MQKWVNNKEEIKNQAVKFKGSQRKRARTSCHDDIDQALLSWFQEKRTTKSSLSGPILRTQAGKLAALMGIPDWKCSEGWLSHWKKRHNIVYKVSQHACLFVPLKTCRFILSSFIDLGIKETIGCLVWVHNLQHLTLCCSA